MTIHTGCASRLLEWRPRHEKCPQRRWADCRIWPRCSPRFRLLDSWFSRLLLPSWSNLSTGILLLSPFRPRRDDVVGPCSDKPDWRLLRGVHHLGEGWIEARTKKSSWYDQCEYEREVCPKNSFPRPKYLYLVVVSSLLPVSFGRLRYRNRVSVFVDVAWIPL